jgi:hypothetical protein
VKEKEGRDLKESLSAFPFFHKSHIHLLTDGLMNRIIDGHHPSKPSPWAVPLPGDLLLWGSH